jgi:hypothetical protein
MLIAYATAEGELASDVGTSAGPYARVLAEEIVKPGIEAVTMFRRVQVRSACRHRSGAMARLQRTGRGAFCWLGTRGNRWRLATCDGLAGAASSTLSGTRSLRGTTRSLVSASEWTAALLPDSHASRGTHMLRQLLSAQLERGHCVKWRGWPTAVQWPGRGLVVAGIAGVVSALRH